MLKSQKQNDDKETTRQFDEILKQYDNPLEIQKRLLVKKREEIIKDKNYGRNK